MLDQLNADALSRASDRNAPQVILSQNTAIDGRVPRWTPPSSVLAIVCWYTPAASGGGWTAWTRRPLSACGTPAAVTGDFLAGTASEEIVVARFRRNVSALGKLRDTPLLFGINGGPPVSRVTAALADGPHIFRVPPCLVALIPADGGFDTRDLIPTALPGSVVSVAYESIPYSCPK